MAFSAEYIYRIIDQYSGPLSKITRTTERFSKAATRAAKSTKDMGSKMRAAGNSMADFGSVAGSALAIIGGSQAMGTFLDYEGAMNSARATTKATAEEFERLSAVAKDLGATTEFSAGQAASAIDMLGRNGLNAAQIMGGAAQATVSLASATGTDLANAANIATDVMANFNKSAGELGVIMDRITGVTINSKFNIDDYRLALAQAGGVAGAVGVSLDDFNASIAAMAPLFSSGSDAGTSFKTFLQRLNPASKEAAKMMQQLGLNFFEASGQMKSMAEISQMLNKAFAGLTEEQKNHAAATMFGTDAMRAAFGLAAAGAGEFDRLSAAIGETSAKGVQAMRMQGLTGVIANLKSAFEGLIIALFDQGGLGSILEGIFSAVTWLIRAVSNANPVLLQFASVAMLVVTGVLAIIAPLGVLITMAGTITTFFAGLSVSIAGLIAPISVAVAGFVAFIAMVKGMWDQSENFRYALSNLASAFSPITDAIKYVASLVSGLLSAALGDSAATFKSWGDMAAVVINMVAAVFKTLFDIIAAVAGFVGNTLVGNFRAAFKSILSLFGPLLRMFDRLIEKVKVFSWIKSGINKLLGSDPTAEGEGVPADVTVPKETTGRREQTNNTSVEVSGQIDVSAAPGAQVDNADINLNRGSNLAMAQ